jgi:hypothetical protein
MLALFGSSVDCAAFWPEEAEYGAGPIVAPAPNSLPAGEAQLRRR